MTDFLSSLVLILYLPPLSILDTFPSVTPSGTDIVTLLIPDPLPVIVAEVCKSYCEFPVKDLVDPPLVGWVVGLGVDAGVVVGFGVDAGVVVGLGVDAGVVVGLGVDAGVEVGVDSGLSVAVGVGVDVEGVSNDSSYTS